MNDLLLKEDNVVVLDEAPKEESREANEFVLFVLDEENDLFKDWPAEYGEIKEGGTGSIWVFEGTWSEGCG